MPANFVIHSHVPRCHGEAQTLPASIGWVSSEEKMKLPIQEPGNREQLLPFEDSKVKGVGFTNTSQLHRGLGYIKLWDLGVS